jgi:GTPase SAR1 family protein
VNHFCEGIPIILVGSKNDLRDDPHTIEELRKYHQHPVTYEEVSVRLCITENYNPMHLHVRGWKFLRGYKQSITSNALE